MAEEKRTQFDYLLNAVLHAAQADKPAEHGYRDKTLALFAYVRQLEAVAQQRGEIRELREAASVLAEFAKTAPGRLPQRVQDAIAFVLADGISTPSASLPMDGEMDRKQSTPGKQTQGDSR